MSFWRLSPKISIYEIVFRFCNKVCLYFHDIILNNFWRKFSVVIFAYLIKVDVRNVLFLLARKPCGTDMILLSIAAVSTLGRSHLVFIDPGVKIIGPYYRDVLLAHHLPGLVLTCNNAQNRNVQWWKAVCAVTKTVIRKFRWINRNF